jgi:hypothetical protein
MENLHPEGLWIILGGVQSREHFATIEKKIAKWR